MAGGKRSVLLLESDPALRRALTASLQGLGLRVEATGQADTARRLQLEFGFDAALLAAEVKVGASGLYLAAYLRIEYPDLPVILLSTHPDAALLREALTLGAVDVLHAPIAPAELQRALLRAFDRPPRSAALTTATVAPTPDEVQRQEIIAALEQTNGRRGEAAKLLGISRSTLWSRVRALGIRLRPTKSMKPRR